MFIENAMLVVRVLGATETNSRQLIRALATNTIPTSGSREYKPKYMLSGVWICDRCGSHYVLGDDRAYACSRFNSGESARSTGVRVRSDIVDPRSDATVSIAGMLSENGSRGAAAVRIASSQASTAPKELDQLDALLAHVTGGIPTRRRSRVLP